MPARIQDEIGLGLQRNVVKFAYIFLKKIHTIESIFYYLPEMMDYKL